MSLPEYSFEAMLRAVEIGQRQFYRMSRNAGVSDVRKRRFTEQEIQLMIGYQVKNKEVSLGTKIRIARKRNR